MRKLMIVAAVVLAATASAAPAQFNAVELSTPKPGLLAATAHAEADAVYVATSKSCINPGNPKGICWWEGYEFRHKNVCIESNIPNAPMVAVAKMFTLSSSLNVTSASYGRCAKIGFKASQTVRFTAFSAADRRSYGKDWCAYTAPQSYGYLTGVYVRVNLTGARSTLCGGGAEWQDVFAHEFGHAIGLSHEQKYSSSIMRDGHTVSAQDAQEIRSIYANNPRR